MLESLIKSIKRNLDLNKLYSILLWKKTIFTDLISTYVFKSKIRAKTPFGFDLVSRNYSANKKMLKGSFENYELDIIKKNLLASEVFVDVGANIGYYSCLARSLGKYVVAFEPQPLNLECLYENLANNGWPDTEVIPVGLSNKPGLLTLYGASGLCASLVKGWAGYSDRFKQIISVNTMDNVLGDRFTGKKLFIKIDVEGAEYSVLLGAEKIISMSPQPTWLIEISPGLFHPDGINPNYSATFELFWRQGYEVCLANKENRLIARSDIEDWAAEKGPCPSADEFNFLFVPGK